MRVRRLRPCRETMMDCRRTLFALVLCLCPLHPATAQDVPPRDMLDAMVRQITSKPAPTAITFDRRSGAPDAVCRLHPAQMNLTRNGSTARSFSVLVDAVSGDEAPKVFFATLSRVAVDAD